jgi:nucleotide-binding universal stress UspA family protein
MLKHVLIPLDGSKLAEKAIDIVKSVMPPGGKMTLLTAVSNSDQLPTVNVDSGEIPVDQYLEHIALRVRLEGFEVETEIRAGDAAEVIAQAAVPLGVDIIAMCSRGRSGLEKLITGSVTNKVLTLTPCPVLVIPNIVRERAHEPIPDTIEAPDLKPGLDA